MRSRARTGRLPSFDIQVTNEDQSTSLGRQTIILKNCLAKGGILAKYDAGAEILDEEIEGTLTIGRCRRPFLCWRE